MGYGGLEEISPRIARFRNVGMMKITAVDSKTKGKKSVDPHPTCVVYI